VIVNDNDELDIELIRDLEDIESVVVRDVRMQDIKNEWRMR
jgi:hypothetical protein